MAAKVRNALALFRPLTLSRNVELRLHQAILYNSIYRADDQLFVNQHTYGIPAAHAPVFHICGHQAARWLRRTSPAWNVCGRPDSLIPGHARRREQIDLAPYSSSISRSAVGWEERLGLVGSGRLNIASRSMAAR